MDSRKFLWSTLKHSNSVFLRTKNSRHSSAFNGVLKKYSTESAQAHEIVRKERIQLTKPSVTKWKRPPFLKGFFIGKFDIELMAFPEILNKGELSELEGHVNSVIGLMGQKVNSMEIDRNQKIPEDTLQDLKDMGLFGRTIPAKYGGLDLTHTASTRLGEALSLDWSISSTLIAHEFFATQAILQFGTEEQKSTYLPKLASGDIIAALCCSEFESGCDLISLATNSTPNADGNFVLNGGKSWVTNAEIAGVFIVLAKIISPVDSKDITISAYIVDRESKGLHIEHQDKACLHGLNVGKVHFENVVVPKSNLLGKSGQGIEIYLKSSESCRIAMSSFTFGSLKALLDTFTNHIIHNERVEVSLGDHHLVRYRLSKICSMIYGMEAAAYFTAAILDSTEKPDVEFESAALKIFNSEGTLYCLRELIELMGSKSLMAETQLERFYRDALGLAMFDAPNDFVRLYLGLSGCKLVGMNKAAEIIKLRNRFFFPIDAMKRDFKLWRVSHGKHYYDHDIAGHLHPSLVPWGNELEYNLNLFEVAVEQILKTYGKKVAEAEVDPIKLANAAAELYVWSAVLSRCSRSYCSGLKNCHHELRLANAFCRDADFRFKRSVQEILMGIIESNQKNHLILGEQVIDCQGYFPEHPLKHNI